MAGERENQGGASTDDQRAAMVFLLRFYMKESGASYADIARAAKIPPAMVGKKPENRKLDEGKHVSNFHSQFDSQYAPQIRGFLEEKIASDSTFQDCSPLILHLIDTMRGIRTPPAVGLDKLLAPVIEQSHEWKQRAAEVYNGVWYVVRFTALQGLDPAPKNEKGEVDQWMIYALMTVDPPNPSAKTDLPRATIHYHPKRDSEHDPPRTIHCNIVSLKEGPYMMVVGYEEGTQYPLVIATDQNKAKTARPTRFRGFVLRKNESGSFITGYAMFIRSRKTMEEIDADVALRKVGVMTQSQLIKLLEPEVPTIGKIIEDNLHNISIADGRRMLVL